MTRYTKIDLETWARAPLYRLFRGYEKPHYATTTRLDVSHLIARKEDGLSTYRACLFAIGTGMHSVAAMRTRFTDTEIRVYDSVEMSMTVPRDGGFGYAYVPFDATFQTFDRIAAARIAQAGGDGGTGANIDRQDLVYLSCLPWLDFTSINNALPGADDCIPRVSWGKFVRGPDARWTMAMALEVHHALVDGEHVAGFFDAVQTALDQI